MRRFIIDLILILGLPFSFLSSLWLKLVVRAGIGKQSEKIFMGMGILPVIDHYYQPLINPKKYLRKSLRENRNLKGIDMKIPKQLELLTNFNYNAELTQFPLNKTNNHEFYYNNGSYCSMIRIFQTEENFRDRKWKFHFNGAECNFKKIKLKIILMFVIIVALSLITLIPFSSIHACSYGPGLRSGVIVHIHDIFTPKDYLDEWVYGHFLWNEQYLLEAFLTSNSDFEIIGALNYLSHNHKDEFGRVCPGYASQTEREPGSFG